MLTAMAVKKPSAKAKSTRPSVACVRLELQLDCRRCQRPVVLTRVAEHMTCRACLHTRPLAASDFHAMAASSVAMALAGTRTADALRTNFGEHYRVRTRIGPAEARCACGAAISSEAIVEALAAGSLRCTCGSTMRVRAPDALVRAFAPHALALAGERDEAAPMHPQVAFRCGCGASLFADGSARAISCVRCGPVDVPEPLWDVLRPTPARSPMYLVVGGGR